MGKTRGRVVKPKNTIEGLELAAKVYRKHQADGAGSELHGLDGYNWDQVGPDIGKAIAFHNNAEALKAEMEAQYRLRDLAFGPIQEITNISSTYLKAKFSKTPKKLGEWGYNVDDSAPVKKKKPETKSA